MATTREIPTREDWRRWGIDPTWHRMVVVEPPRGPAVEWSILDTGEGPRGTIVCVHGNPTWGYLWRGFLETLGTDWRVIAVDQTGMGWSERSAPRGLEERVEELVAFCQQHTSGPLVLVAHDWGGPVALGAVASLDVRAVILGNTGVALPERTPMPPLIATARRLTDLACRRTSVFVRGTAAMTDGRHRRALRAPYRSADRRAAVAEFVADIPLDEADVAWEPLQASARNLAALRVPVLFVWGGRDPVFHDRFLADLLRRAPHGDVHRFPNAGHLVPLDEPMAEVASLWLDDVLRSTATDDLRAADVERMPDATGADEGAVADVTSALRTRSSDDSVAFSDASGSVSWRSLAGRASAIARMLVEQGLSSGDRVAMLVPPGRELLAAAYGVWMAGGVLVVADSGLGPKGLRSVLRAADVRWVFGTPKTLVASRALGWTPGARTICTERFPRAIGVRTHAAPIETRLPTLEPLAEAAVVHTSGSTGPAKPVRYRHGALAAQRDVIAESFGMVPDRGFVTSFAPFILLGPALGVPCVLPDIDVTDPSELDFDRLARVIESSSVDVAWLSPASADRIVATAAGRTVELRLVMLAGAPISSALAASVVAVTGADVRSPWGMTEALPLSDGVGATHAIIDGTLTGRPLPGANVVVLPLEGEGLEPLATGRWGELAVHAAWMFDGYEQQWATEHRSEVSIDGVRFHRTGDLGLVDGDGVLHQYGRVQHAISLASGVVPCALIEQPLEVALGRRSAAVGVGPRGTQVVVVIIEATGSLRLADPSTVERVRGTSQYDIAAVLEGELPVDVRHRSKIRREVLAAAASSFLAGR